MNVQNLAREVQSRTLCALQNLITSSLANIPSTQKCHRYPYTQVFLSYLTLTHRQAVTILLSYSLSQLTTATLNTSPEVGSTKTLKTEREVEVDLYSALLKYLKLKALRYRSHSVTCKLHRTCLYLVSIHQMAHPQTEGADI